MYQTAQQIQLKVLNYSVCCLEYAILISQGHLPNIILNTFIFGVEIFCNHLAGTHSNKGIESHIANKSHIQSIPSKIEM